MMAAGRGSGSPAGERGGKTLRERFEAWFNRDFNPSVPAYYRSRVVSYKYLGKDGAGKPIYKITRKMGGRIMHTTHAWSGSNLGAPTPQSSPQSRPEGTGGSGSSAGEGSGNADLDAAKEQWYLTVLNAPLSGYQKDILKGNIENYSGSAAGLNNMMAKLIKPTYGPGATAIAETEEFPAFDPFAGLDFGGGGGGGFGGGGSLGPVYVAPDKRVVEDFVKGALVSLVGGVPSDEMVDGMVSLYMTDHRRDFDSETEDIDPAQSVQEAIRQTENYQTIHQLRPESEDEREWVAQRRQAAAEGGLDTGRQEDFAITQATVGGDIDDVEKAASVAQFQQSGSARGTLLDTKIRETARAMFSQVIR